MPADLPPDPTAVTSDPLRELPGPPSRSQAAGIDAGGRLATLVGKSAAAWQTARSVLREQPVAVVHVAPGGGNCNGLRKAVAELSHAQASNRHRVALHLSGPHRFHDVARRDGEA